VKKNTEFIDHTADIGILAYGADIHILLSAQKPRCRKRSAPPVTAQAVYRAAALQNRGIDVIQAHWQQKVLR